DVLRFGEGISPEQVVVARRGGLTSSNYGDLELGFESGDERVTVKDFFYEKRHQIERVEFAEGTAWDVDTIKAMLLRGTEEAQTLWGYEEGSEIHGGGGDDRLNGNRGKDYLYGDAGDDTLEGGPEDDTLDGGVGNDVLRGENGNDRLAGGSGADRLDGGAGNDVLTGDEGNDTLEGGQGRDMLEGGQGNDRLEGGNGSDTYLFSRGGGQDVIAEHSSESGDVDVLRFGEGISPEQVVVARRGGLTSSNYGDLALSLASGDDRVTVKDFFYEKRHQIER
ncbi:hypothetical protein J5069_23590, partial [Candidatus Symbiopectobacterium sp. NZEC127]|uniref:calcium-binding protein n=1 Tax=Candidatus Symbiopectobacterium sp. NZEC127 TaxID=2820472 RepID=UPI0029CAAFC9